MLQATFPRCFIGDDDLDDGRVGGLPVAFVYMCVHMECLSAREGGLFLLFLVCFISTGWNELTFGDSPCKGLVHLGRGVKG